MSKEYHINVSKSDIENSEYCIICGDPDRVPRISKFLRDTKELSFHRGYHIHLGYINDSPIIVASTGIGAPTTAIGIEEFGFLGVKTFIRVGTSGILSDKVKLGDIVSAIGAIRDEGTSKQYIDYQFPAVANPDVIIALRRAVKRLGFSSIFHEGIVHSKDSFYSETPKLMPDPNISHRWEMWKRAGTLITEMECSILFTISQIRGWRSGGIIAAIGNIDSGVIILDPKKGQEEAIKTAIEAVKILLETDATVDAIKVLQK